jgi:hypothetical protein
MTAPTVVAVPMTAGGPSEHMVAVVQVEPEGVWLSLGRNTGSLTGAPMTVSEALELAHQLVVAAGGPTSPTAPRWPVRRSA